MHLSPVLSFDHCDALDMSWSTVSDETASSVASDSSLRSIPLKFPERKPKPANSGSGVVYFVPVDVDQGPRRSGLVSWDADMEVDEESDETPTQPRLSFSLPKLRAPKFRAPRAVRRLLKGAREEAPVEKPLARGRNAPLSPELVMAIAELVARLGGAPTLLELTTALRGAQTTWVLLEEALCRLECDHVQWHGLDGAKRALADIITCGCPKECALMLLVQAARLLPESPRHERKGAVREARGELEEC